MHIFNFVRNNQQQLVIFIVKNPKTVITNTTRSSAVAKRPRDASCLSVVSFNIPTAQFLPRDAMHKRGLCRHAVTVRLSVCLSVTFVDHVKTNKYIFEIFTPSGSHTILVFPYQTGWRDSDGNPPPSNGGVECRWGRQNTRFLTNIWLYWTCVYWCLQHIYRVTLIGVFHGHFRINLHQTRTQYSNERPQHWNAAEFLKNAFQMWNFVAEKQLFSLFFAVSAANLHRCQKSINDVTPTSDTPALGLKQLNTLRVHT